MSESDFNKVFSRQLNYYLNKYEMTQLELSKRLGVGTTSVSNWCRGLKSPRMDKVDAMCKVFNCSRSDLMEERSLSADRQPASPVLSDEETQVAVAYRSASANTKAIVRLNLGIDQVVEEKETEYTPAADVKTV